MRSGDQLLLVVSRADGSIVAVEGLERTESSLSLRRRKGRHRRRRGFSAAHDRRLLALPVLAALFVSTSALAVPSEEAVTRVPRQVEPIVVSGPVTPVSTDSPAPEPAPRSVPTAVPRTLPITPDPTVPEGRVITDPVERCRALARRMPLAVGDAADRNLLAQMIHATFECIADAEQLDDRPPTENRSWSGAETWGFESLAAQVAAEAVVVGYCESLGFRHRVLGRDNPWGYGGIFQMGTAEMRRFGPAGGDKFDPVDNTVAAARYFVWGLERGHRWGGWGPWAVVNTDFGDINDHVLVPVLPRFASTDPSRRGRTGSELPDWAADPWAWTVPEWGGCPAMVGWTWPETPPLD